MSLFREPVRAFESFAFGSRSLRERRRIEADRRRQAGVAQIEVAGYPDTRIGAATATGYGQACHERSEGPEDGFHGGRS